MNNIIIGSHVSFNKKNQLLGCVREALEYGANTFMFYTGAPQNTVRLQIDDDLTQQAMKLMNENNIDKNNVIIHAPYIINLANKDNIFAITFLKQELLRIERLGFNKVVLHPGSHVGQGKEVGIKNVIDGLNQVIDNETKITILLETMAGKGSEVGISFEEIKTIIDGVKENSHLGVCLDTCHINDAGYDVGDFDYLLSEFDRIIGLDKLMCVHVNDSKNDRGTSKDRHENFGLGIIGFDKLIKVIYHEKLKNVPKILETPYVTKDDSSTERIYPPYKFEIESIKSKKKNNNLINNIREYYK